MSIEYPRIDDQTVVTFRVSVPIPIDEIPVAVSYSGGASSEWLIHAYIQGWVKRPKYFSVVCADTTVEHAWTYEAIERVERLCQSEGIQFVRETAGALGADLLAMPALPDGSRMDHPPLWLETAAGRGQAQHRCTRRYKIRALRRATTRWLKQIGKPKRIRTGEYRACFECQGRGLADVTGYQHDLFLDDGACEAVPCWRCDGSGLLEVQLPGVIRWVGFGADEAHRAHKTVGKMTKEAMQLKSGVAWEGVAFPALRTGRSRAQQRHEVASATGSAPPWSMCTICPWKSRKRWLETPAHEQRYAIEVDEAIRDSSAVGLESPAYLASQLIPVSELIRKGDRQTSLYPELESQCDAGACFL